MRGVVALVVMPACIFALGTGMAVANDANHKPPEITLTASGADGVIGPSSRSLAFFSTPTTYGPDADPKAGYTPDSRVTFACTLDGRPIRCSSEYLQTSEGGGGVFFSAQRAPTKPRYIPSEYIGSVPTPEHLASGPHTVTVVATDEDGTDPNPPTVEVTLDREPPTKPVLITKPPKRSRIHKPNFRFRSEDDIRFVTSRTESFFARLRRVRPNREVFTRRGEAGFFSPWVQDCPSLLTCTGQAKVAYFVPGFGGLELGMAEWLPPGLYEIFVSARDAAGNKSRLTRYRFRILPGSPGR
jgi:hypothetical protein